MAQTKYLPTGKFSMYKVDRCGSDFQLENKSAGRILGQDLEGEVVCVPASGRAKGVVP